MFIIKDYEDNMQNSIEEFFEKCINSLGWTYEPYGRHNDIKRINEIYGKNGNFLCLCNDEKIIGTVGIHSIDEINKIIEMKRLYILPQYQKKGFGKCLFKIAIDLAKINLFKKIVLETRNDRNEILHFMEKYKFKKIEKYSNNPFSELSFEKELGEYNI